MITLPLSVFAVPLSLYRPFPLSCKPNLGLVFKVLCFFFCVKREPILFSVYWRTPGFVESVLASSKWDGYEERL